MKNPKPKGKRVKTGPLVVSNQLIHEMEACLDMLSEYDAILDQVVSVKANHRNLSYDFFVSLVKGRRETNERYQVLVEASERLEAGLGKLQGGGKK